MAISKDAKNSSIALKIENFKTKEYRRLDLISTIGLSVSFFTLGILSQGLWYRKNWNKAVKEINEIAALPESEESREITETTES